MLDMDVMDIFFNMYDFIRFYMDVKLPLHKRHGLFFHANFEWYRSQHLRLSR
jgi:hypothetical protein